MNKRFARRQIRKSPIAKAWPVIERLGCDGYSIVIDEPPEFFDQNEMSPYQRLVTKFIQGVLSPKDLLDFDPESTAPIAFTEEALRREAKIKYRPIRMSPEYRDGTKGKRSRFGGLPLVPADFEWPSRDGEFFEFLGQIFLDELPKSPARDSLPHDGSLLFFLDTIQNYTDAYIGSKVIYVSAGTKISQIAGHPRKPDSRPEWAYEDKIDPATQATVQCDLIFRPRFFLPEASPDPEDHKGELDLALEAIGLEDVYDVFSELKEQICENKKLGYNNYGHRLLGVQTSIQSSAIEHVRGDPFNSPKLLMQFTPFGAFQWGDVGHLHIFIEEDALAAGNFDHTAAVWECG